MTIRTGCLSVVRTLKVERLKISKQKEAFLDLFIRKYCSDCHGCDQTDYQSPCVYSVCFPLSVVGSCLICLLPVCKSILFYSLVLGFCLCLLSPASCSLRFSFILLKLNFCIFFFCPSWVLYLGLFLHTFIGNIYFMGHFKPNWTEVKAGIQTTAKLYWGESLIEAVNHWGKIK